MRNFLNKMVKTKAFKVICQIVLWVAAICAATYIVYNVYIFAIAWIQLFKDGTGWNPIVIPVTILFIVFFAKPVATIQFVFGLFRRK